MPVVHSLNQEQQISLIGGCQDGSPLLVIDRVSFNYPDGHKALDDISFCVAPGEKVALVGPNGAGKSTLMLLLNGLLSGQGRIKIGGLNVTRENMPAIRARTGLVFQNPDDQLFSPTVYEDVAFGPLHMGFTEEEIYHKVHHALHLVGMSKYAERLSHHLSVGEKKRIAIATVLSMDPDILVLDEPTAGLDPRARRSLINLLRELPITMLVSTHDMLLVPELFNRLIVLDEGRLVADGAVMDLVKDEGFMEDHGLESPFTLNWQGRS
ncbi:MAG: ABC transporter ATP-binding protein [Chloroflexi bacterium]|nr:MAG: ABC transporter ATP-binding protein [Chloroflexota bacterium]